MTPSHGSCRSQGMEGLGSLAGGGAPPSFPLPTRTQGAGLSAKPAFCHALTGPPHGSQWGCMVGRQGSDALLVCA